MDTPTSKEILKQYCMGQPISESARTQVERALILDQEMLLNFLDLKRQLDGAPEIPAPNPTLLPAMLRKIKRPKYRSAYFWPLAASAFATAILLVFLKSPYRQPEYNSQPKDQNSIKFDSGSELPGSSNVL